jgi:flagellar basal-body rod protein FlgC
LSFYSSIEVSATGLSAQRLAMDVIANNIANVNTTRTPKGGSYKRQLVVFAQKQEPTPSAAGATDDDPAKSRAGVEAVGIVNDTGPDRLVYVPHHPDADAAGYVHYPNIDVVKEMVDMMAASRAYEANVTAITETRTMGTTLLNLLKA